MQFELFIPFQHNYRQTVCTLCVAATLLVTFVAQLLKVPYDVFTNVF